MAHHRKILIIDDTIDDFERCSRLLKRESSATGSKFIYETLHANNGEEGLALIMSAQPDLVLLDYSLPGVNGLGVLNSIQLVAKDLPVIMMTGMGNEELVVELLKAGAKDYLAKTNMNRETLIKAITNLLTVKPANYLASGKKHIRILIVDDSSDDRELIIRRVKKIQHVDYNCQEAGSGEEAFHLIDEGAPDCVLLDYSMPGHDGLQVLGQMIKHSPFLPIIILTGQGSEVIATQAIKSGAQHYLVKSTLTTEVLDSAITSAIEHKQLEFKIAENNKHIAQYQQSVLESRERLNLVLAATNIITWDYDLISDKVQFNDQISVVLGHQWPNNELSATELETYIHPNDRATKKSIYTIKDGEYNTFSVVQRMRSQPGEWKWLQVKGKIVAKDDQGRPLRIVGTYQDITEEKATLEQLIKSNEDLERYAYIASHDLQEPLRMVVSFTALLEKHYGNLLDARAKEYMHFATSNAKRMQALIFDLLEYSRIGKVSETSRKTDLNEIISSVKENLAGSIIEADAIIQSTPLPVIYANPARMVSLFQNLIGNAIKYRRAGRVPRIEISVSEKNEYYSFLISDNGIGMKQEYCSKIFEPFQRLHRNEKYTGTGMGLPICRKIIEELNGCLWAESEMGVGTKIWFAIPIQTSVKK